MKNSKTRNLTDQQLYFKCEPTPQTETPDRPEINTPPENILCPENNICEKHIDIPDISQNQPQMRMSQKVFTNIILTICPKPPEAGGILLGPIDSNDITKFFFDHGANCSGSTYSPDYITLRRMMREEWIPSGIDMKGFCHSHPNNFDCLSQGDLNYIARLLQKNQDMDIFFAPIIIPAEYRMRSLAVLRNTPETPQEAELILF